MLEAFGALGEAVEERVDAAGGVSKMAVLGELRVREPPTRTRMQCEASLFRRQMKRATSSQPGTGVTMSAGV